MSIANKSRIQGIIMMVVGGILLLAYKTQGDGLGYSNLVFGLGIGFFSGGVGALIGPVFTKGRFKGNYEVQEKDERLHQIWDKAGHISYGFSYLIVLFMLVVAAITNISAMTVLVALLVIMPFLHLGFTYYYNKKI